MRDYSKLEIPYRLAGWKLRLGFDRLRPFWHLLPFELATRINDAYAKREDLTITKADLDSLSDQAWSELEKRL